MGGSPTAGAPRGTQFQGPLRLTRRMADAGTDAVPSIDALGPWFVAGLATNQTAKVLTIGTADCTQLTAPAAGSILGLSVDMDAAPAAGTYGIRIWKNNTNLGGIFVLTGLTVQAVTRYTDNMTSATFAAGDRLKVVASSSNTLTANRDLSVHVWVA